MLHFVQAVAVLGPELQQSSSLNLALKRRGLNDRLLKVERAFLDDDGIPGDSWYKHLVSLIFWRNNPCTIFWSF